MAAKMWLMWKMWTNLPVHKDDVLKRSVNTEKSIIFSSTGDKKNIHIHYFKIEANKCGYCG